MGIEVREAAETPDTAFTPAFLKPETAGHRHTEPGFTLNTSLCGHVNEKESVVQKWEKQPTLIQLS